MRRPIKLFDVDDFLPTLSDVYRTLSSDLLVLVGGSRHTKSANAINQSLFYFGYVPLGICRQAVS